MASTQSFRTESLVVRKGQTLIAIPELENGEPIIRYFIEDNGDPSLASADVLQRALNAIGSWSDMDWEATEAALDRIRHESTPTPPIDLDDIL